MFSKILVANRGEIAVKIVRSCKRMGIRTVAIYSTADKDALHAMLADESYCVGAASATDSYLNMRAILSVATATGAQAIHPGYGFLAESFDFARLCEENGIKFIGPPSDVMRAMSDKALAKKAALENGLHVILGEAVDFNADEIEKAAEKLGYPVLAKPLNGGGGRGIQVLRGPQDVRNFVSAAEKTFYGDKTLLEKYISPASHVEMQIVADEHGHVLCLGERDCSIQDKNQKLIEEAPCAKLNANQRGELFEQCVKLAKSVSYVGCGTMEFLLDACGRFHFMEMNCRLQVEHPVTELTTGLNLVELQILVAAGEELKLEQNDIKVRGCALESRINICNAGEKNLVSRLNFAGNDDVIFETFLYEGCQVPVFYDALVGKLVARGDTREEAIDNLEKALDALKIEGIETNIGLHKRVLRNEIFRIGRHDTGFFELYYKKKYLSAHERLAMLIDDGSFVEHDAEMTSRDVLNFPQYKEKLRKAKEATSLNEAVVYGEAKISGRAVVIFVMDGNFMMGTMGRVVGEKIKRAFDLACEKNLPVIGVTVSGGARMQEGIFSLLQMVKTSAAVKRHSDKGLLYVCVVTNPTLGGVAASFASVADIIIAEEGAVFGFAGRRIVEDTTKEKLPADFQTAEDVLRHGMVDMVVTRDNIRPTLARILRLHGRRFYENNN